MLLCSNAFFVIFGSYFTALGRLLSRTTRAPWRSMNLSRGQRLTAASHVVSAISKSSTPAIVSMISPRASKWSMVCLKMGAGFHRTFDTSNFASMNNGISPGL
jgi:hypothetical protein